MKDAVNQWIQKYWFKKKKERYKSSLFNIYISICLFADFFFFQDNPALRLVAYFHYVY